MNVSIIVPRGRAAWNTGVAHAHRLQLQGDRVVLTQLCDCGCVGTAPVQERTFVPAAKG